MTIGKASLLAAGFIAAMALGAAIGPSLLHREAAIDAPPAVEVSQPPAAPATAPAAVAPPPRATKSASARAVAVPASTAKLHQRLKPVLNPGANMRLAAEGFRDGEQFATVAHAARNTQVPFMLLKHRVLKEGRTLSAAIRASKPDVDVASEVKRAQSAARSDIAAISS